MWKKAVVCLAFLVVLSSSVFAVEYSTEYPSYVPISGGAYIEVQSTLGVGRLSFRISIKTILLVLAALALIFVTLLILQSVGISIPPLEALFRSVSSVIPR